MSNRRREPPSDVSTGGVQSVDRAVSVLEILARRGEAGVSEVAAHVGVHKSTAFRLLGALEGRDLVEQTQQRGKYRLGFGILRLAGAIPGRLDVIRQGHPVCETLAAQVGETVNLAVLQSHFAVNLDQVRGPSAVAAHNWVGQLTALHATSSGKVLLAALPAERRAALLKAAGMARFTARTVTSAAALERQLRTVAADGFAVCIEEFEDGLNALAAPIRDHTARVVAALSVSGPAYRFTEQRMKDVTGDVVAAAAMISSRMGDLS